jgi:hypothetical protein
MWHWSLQSHLKQGVIKEFPVWPPDDTAAVDNKAPLLHVGRV